MSSYKPLNLRPLVVVYNLGCAGLNLYIGLEIFLTSRQIDYSWTCQPVDYSWDPSSVRIARALWWYYISKLVELCGKFVGSVRGSGCHNFFCRSGTSLLKALNFPLFPSCLFKLSLFQLSFSLLCRTDSRT